jgi:hypothetical protein
MQITIALPDDAKSAVQGTTIKQRDLAAQHHRAGPAPGRSRQHQGHVAAATNHGATMEKLVYLLWKDDRQSRGEFSQVLLRELAPELVNADAVGVQLNLVDDAIVAAEHMLIENSKPRYHAMVSVWLESAFARQPIEQRLLQYAPRIAGYLVCESSPLPNTSHVAAPPERTTGFCQVVLLRRPPRLRRQEWLSTWLDSHTQIAIDTQASFAYRQNVVVRALTDDAPSCDAIVEESFPAAAMDNREVFFAAQGDPALLQKHQQAMIDSCSRFIDFDKMEACPTSEYVVKSWRTGV